MIDFRRQIKDQMDRQGISQNKLAIKAGVSRVRLNMFLRGKGDMMGRNLEKVLDVLGMELVEEF